MSTRGALTTLRRRGLGVALLMCMVLFVVTTLAFYNRAFTSTVDVILKAQATGNQLLPEADVKVRGMIIGSVQRIEATDSGADLHLSLEPEHAEQLPANVSAQLIPQTLFGERYVSLEFPERAESASLASGEVIQQDQTAAGLELERVLSNTMPLLRAVHPDDLASTLNAVDRALSGRGEQLGETISQLNTYLGELNPSVPDLRDNLRELVGVAQTYEQAAPDVVQALDNLSTTSRTLVQRRSQLDDLTTQLTSTSGDTERFLRDNGDTIIQLGEHQRPTVDTLAKYSPQFPCFLGEMSDAVPRIREAFGEGKDPGLHITLEVTAHRGKYVPEQDEPEFNDDRGPRCYSFDPSPEPLPEYPPDGPFQDGSEPPPASQPIQDGIYPPGALEEFIPEPTPPGANDGQEQPERSADEPASTQPSAAGMGPQNSPAEGEFISSVIAPAVGKPAADVPGWGSLLVGPVLRGAEVSYE